MDRHLQVEDQNMWVFFVWNDGMFRHSKLETDLETGRYILGILQTHLTSSRSSYCRKLF